MLSKLTRTQCLIKPIKFPFSPFKEDSSARAFVWRVGDDVHGKKLEEILTMLPGNRGDQINQARSAVQ